MHLTIRLFGMELLDLDLADVVAPQPDPAKDLSGGSTLSEPTTGFTTEQPDEAE